MSESFTFTKNKDFLDASSAVGVSLMGTQAADVLAAIAKNKPFPARQIELGSLQLSASTGENISFLTGKGKVNFSASANAFAGLGVYPDPAEMLAALQLNESFQDNLAGGLVLKKDDDTNYLALRWGYDLKGSAKGAIALGAPGSITFGVDGSRAGVYAVIRQLPKTTGARDAIDDTVNSWILPSHVTKFSDLDPGTWLIAEVDGSFGAKIGATFGYDFNWVREAELGGLSGDIGLRIQLGVNATLSFFASGNYAVVVSRETDDKIVRLQIFKLAKKGWNFAFNANARVQADFSDFLPDSPDDFVAAVFGVHGAQIVKDLQVLEKWTDPDKDLSEIIAGLTSEYTQKLVKEVTGIDPQIEFEKARKTILGLLQKWNDLDHRVATMLWKLVEEKVDLKDVRAVAKLIADGTEKDYEDFLNDKLKSVNFFTTPTGRWLESVAIGNILRPLNNNQEFDKLQVMARRTLGILDGSTLENVFSNLQDYINKNLHLDQITKVVNENSFNKIDLWLQARMSTFLGEKFDFSQLNKIKNTINLVLSKRKIFYEKALEALNHQYEFSFAATWQSTTTNSALLDVQFDFAKPVGDLLARALDGDFDTLLVTPQKGVTLNTAVLTHGIKRHQHVEFSVPFFNFTSDHFNESLASVTPDKGISAEQGRVLIYELDAHDETLDVVRGKSIRDSSLSVGATLTEGLGALRAHSAASFSFEYTLRQAVKNMRSDHLSHQLRPFIDAYFGKLFNAELAGGHTGSMEDWIADSDKAIDQIEDNGTGNFGNTLISLNVSLPGDAAKSWLHAPADANARTYMDLSRRLQQKLKELLLITYFDDPEKYKDIAAADALLMYAALPISTNVRITNGEVQFNRDDQPYWDIETAMMREAIARSPQAMANLNRQLDQIHTRLSNLAGFGNTAAFYKPGDSALIRIRKTAMDGMQPQFRSLLSFEQRMVNDAVKVGCNMAQFAQNAAQRPSEAVKFLAEFGTNLTTAFHHDLKNVYGGNALRPLGAMIFLEATSIIDANLAPFTAQALLQISVVRAAEEFPPAKFPAHKPLPESALLMQEMLVNF